MGSEAEAEAEAEAELYMMGKTFVIWRKHLICIINADVIFDATWITHLLRGDKFDLWSTYLYGNSVYKI